MLKEIFMGKKTNLVKFVWFVKYIFNVFTADLNLRKNVFQIDMPPSFLSWRIKVLALPLDLNHSNMLDCGNRVTQTFQPVLQNYILIPSYSYELMLPNTWRKF